MPKTAKSSLIVVRGDGFKRGELGFQGNQQAQAFIWAQFIAIKLVTGIVKRVFMCNFNFE
jgi:hypothetical protein